MVSRIFVEVIGEHRPVVLQIALYAAVIFVAQLVELGWIAYRQRLEQDSMDEGEDRGVRANTNRQRQQRRDCESRRFAQLPHRVPNILNKSLHRSS